ncbi:GTP 3',8-cyclase MoaA [Orrella dioscoreae]|uniref:GTP 3',8-cyclase n=1 Tax=Orrella dioscoreae TaxID=1851544 RepID=A0A1C3JXZ9_9BURK|nr:GTP 3',8-cyclase MoaA [Orrella dioscoreae]SBT24162.1 Molybdenum cofactor biosynthesis protein MoaA [Orrella dioscoreae]SOE51388.1 Molybdenum cofactor biosynthesis protein MoaA [Orrella dioscoreae]
MSKVIFLARDTPAAPSYAGAARHAPAPGVTPLDARGRPLRDLRISVTDRCNFRCGYCMPRDVFDANYQFLPHADMLTFEEIARLASHFVDLGVEKIRLTGGEPLMRRNLDALVGMLAELRTPAGKPLDLTLTTNGILLARRARALRAAGLTRVSVSLDALDPVLFRRMSDADFSPDDVLRGIDAAAEAGLAPLKVNMVVRRGLNDHQILPMARRFRHSGHVLRFIEYMDVGNTNGWNLAEVVPGAEVLARIGAEHPLSPLSAHYAGEVAERWAYDDGAGEIGVITSVTHAFCGDCNRARLSPEGRLYTCLFASQGHDLRGPLRQGADPDQLRGLLASLWGGRTDAYSELRGRAEAPAGERRIEMSYIGG